MDTLDAVRLNFSPLGLTVLNVCLGLVMFGVALALRFKDFRRILRRPHAVVAGMVAQFVLLPAATWLLIQLLRPPSSLALGMMLVACCPGGNLSNFMSLLAGGNAALSVSLTAASSLSSIVLTPLNFGFWAGLLLRGAGTDSGPADLHVDPLRMGLSVALLLGLPLLAGLCVATRWPSAAARYGPRIRQFSLLCFALFVVAALLANGAHFLRHIDQVFLPVALHNALALGLGFGFAALVGLGPRERRTLSIETGIQNSGLGLVLVFNFFDGLGGMALVAAWWGVWHILSGLTLVRFWSRRPV